MQSSDAPPKTLAVEFNEERLRAWKEKRAQIAAASRQERSRLAEAEKTDRARVQEQQKQQRLKEAAEARAAEEAEKRLERLQAARIRLAGRADVDAARKRLAEYRKMAARRIQRQIGLYVVLPTLLVAAYLFLIATPLYEASTTFSVRSETAGAQDIQSGFLTPPAGHKDSAQLRAFILSPQMMDTLDQKNGFFDHMGSDEVDPLTRLRPVPALQITDLDQYRRAVQVSINSQEGIIRLRTSARDPQTAIDFAQTVIGGATTYAANAFGSGTDVVMISPPSVAAIPQYPRRIPGVLLAAFVFFSAFGLISIFGATLRRHGQI